jgi:hypothetical protein
MMGHLSTIDLVGFWLAIFLTFCILSFLYGDNPFYKFAEHLFIGVSIGYLVNKQYQDVVRPKLIDNLGAGGMTSVWYVIALLLCLMLLSKVSRRWGWLGRYPIAFVVAFTAGIQINGALQGDFGPQVDRAMSPVVVPKVDINTATVEELNGLPGMSPSVSKLVIERRAAQPFTSLDEIEQLEGLTPMQRADLAKERNALKGLDAQATVRPPPPATTIDLTAGSRPSRGPGPYWFGTASQILMLLGLISALVYFYFSIPQTGAVGKVARFGVWILMIGFGASFGYTVQGRLSLAIGRALDVLGRDKDPIVAEQIHGPLVAAVSIAIIVAGIAMWEARRRRHQPRAGGGGA